MFNSLRKLISEIGEGGKHPSRFEDDDYRLAAAALLVHAASIDGNVSDVERNKLHGADQAAFQLWTMPPPTNWLPRPPPPISRPSIFISSPPGSTARLTKPARARVVEMMWQIVYADGIVTEFEDNLIWRAADLLGVSRDERIALRERVAAARRTGKKS